MELGRRVPLGESRDSTTLRNPVVFELSPAMKLALGLRNPPFHPFSIPPFPTLVLGLSKEKRGTRWLELKLLLLHLVVSRIEQIKKLGLWEQKYLGGAYSK